MFVYQVVNVPITHHPTIGDIISDRYLKLMETRARPMLERFQQHVTGGTDTAPEVVLVLAGTNDVCNEVGTGRRNASNMAGTSPRYVIL